MHDILHRIAIAEDTSNAAERSMAHAWAADYARWRLALIAGEDTEAGA